MNFVLKSIIEYLCIVVKLPFVSLVMSPSFIHGYFFYTIYFALLSAAIVFLIARRRTGDIKRALKSAGFPFCFAIFLRWFNFLGMKHQNYFHAILYGFFVAPPFFFAAACLFSRRWRLSIGISLISCLLFFGVVLGLLNCGSDFCYSAMHFHNTVYAADFTRAGFSQIEIGMSKQETKGLIGVPLNIDVYSESSDKPESGSLSNREEYWRYSRNGDVSSQKIVYNVVFDGRGKVSEKIHTSYSR